MPSPPGVPPEAKFGERLKDARQQLNLSVEALSRLTKRYDAQASKGVSPPTISRYEGNDTLPTLRELRLLAEALDVPAQWLLDGNISKVKGSTEAAQRLVDAMTAFCRAVQEDINIGGAPLSHHQEWHKKRERAELLAEVRRPTGD